jgi:hypothetical protein
MGAHIALRPGPPMGFLGWVLPQRTRPMGAHSAVYLYIFSGPFETVVHLYKTVPFSNPPGHGILLQVISHENAALPLIVPLLI